MKKNAHALEPETLLELGRTYQASAVFLAAAELDIFSALAGGDADASSLARQLQCDERGLTVLLDAAAGLGLINKDTKSDGSAGTLRPTLAESAGSAGTLRPATYSLPAGGAELLTPQGSRSILAMAQHQANCLRNWAQLAMTVKTGKPAPKIPSVRGAEGDAASFIGAMHNISAPVADEVIAAIQPLKFSHLLDIGGASGTWTMAFLRACPSGRATLFDLPHVIPMAQRRLSEASMAERVSLVAGDFMTDPLPGGSDLAWVSAIVHQNTREENRQLFAKTYKALQSGGRIAIRDIVMDDSHTQPVGGALFAINMLVATEGGGTFTLPELREDLESAGFSRVALVRKDEWMNSIIVATRENQT
jgi:ubiquinone/menaquinone biosynthesis C-methylase UbiE